MVLVNHLRSCLRGFVLLAATGAMLTAAPRLTLTQTALSVATATGSNGTAQTVDAGNLGDGSLQLQVASSVSWLTPAVGQPHSCTLKGICLPIQIGVSSASLAKGTYTGTVTVSDPNAVDAPQFIVVTLHVGGAVPDKLEFFVQPGGSASSDFTTATKASTSVSANTPWLSVAVNGSGSFTFNVPYRITAAAASGMPATDYNGTVTVNGSSLAADNKQVGVLMHVTTQPILQAIPSTLQIRIAQGAVKQSSTTGAIPYLATVNAGQGSLSITKVSAAAAASGTWLGASTVSGFPSLVAVSADPAGLSPGIYTGTVTIASNAANSSVDVPVQLTIEPSTAPVAFAGRAVNNGTFGPEPLARGDVVAVFGDQFTYGDPKTTPAPLPLTLDQTQVLVNGQPAPLYYVFPGQLAFEMPIDAQLGDGTVQVVRGGQKGNLVHITVTDRSPHFLLINGGPYVIMTTPEGALTGIPSHPAKSGDVVVIYTIGMGATAPPVATGTASPSPPANAADTKVCFGEQSPFVQPVCVTPDFSGLTPASVGLYQINVKIPALAQKGDLPIHYTVGGTSSDSETITIQ